MDKIANNTNNVLIEQQRIILDALEQQIFVVDKNTKELLYNNHVLFDYVDLDFNNIKQNDTVFYEDQKTGKYLRIKDRDLKWGDKNAEIIFVEDLTRQRDEEKQKIKKYKKRLNEIMASVDGALLIAKVNLTKDTVKVMSSMLDGQPEGKHSFTRGIEKMAVCIDQDIVRNRFKKHFSREALLKLVNENKTSIAESYPCFVHKNEVAYVEISINFMVNPYSGDCEGVMICKDTTEQYLLKNISDFVISRGYDAISVINLKKEEYILLSLSNENNNNIYGERENLKEKINSVANNLVAREDKEEFLKNISPENVVKQLEKQDVFNFSIHVHNEDSSISLKRIILYYLDKYRRIIVCILEDCAVEERFQFRHEYDKKISKALVKDYTSVYYIDLYTEDYELVKLDNVANAIALKNRYRRYSDVTREYAEKFVLDEYRKGFLACLEKEYLKEYLRDNESLAYRYKVKKNAGGQEYFELIVVKVDEHNGQPCAIVGFRCVDDIARVELLHTKKLNEAKLAAEQASRAKSMFLSNMSHDIRTPMNAIMNMLDFLRNDIKNEKKALEDLDKIESSSRFMLALINDILDMAKIESGEMKLRPEVVFKDEFINNLKNVFMPLCESKKIKFIIEPKNTKYPLWVDKVRFYQVFYNLLSNAVKFTPEGGTIKYREENVVIKDNKITLDYYISDTGIGMSEEFQKVMFDPFEREDEKKQNGTGLGLAIVKRVVDLKNGTIHVNSKKGKGTTFIVHYTLPLATKEQIQAAMLENGVDNKSSIKGMKILVAEDNLINQEIIKRLLEEKGAVADVAIDGRDVVQKFAASDINYYDAILMDIQMPVMNGLEATKEIRKTDRQDAKSIVIIAITANAFDDDKQFSMEAGMDAHLSKPVDIEKIEHIVSINVKNKRNKYKPMEVIK